MRGSFVLHQRTIPSNFTPLVPATQDLTQILETISAVVTGNGLMLCMRNADVNACAEDRNVSRTSFHNNVVTAMYVTRASCCQRR